MEDMVGDGRGWCCDCCRLPDEWMKSIARMERAVVMAAILAIHGDYVPGRQTPGNGFR